ncbi:hypothetical protein CXG81DRAFT_17760 [Caulochytrium protostelioides]|uniref:C2HC/C3H-type domain-containing protein n=1 Tax=Caulochytrium protostelioides TaxID=1555241 RepID=A0A4P9X073_9FUNG|nr:hypothetical protein CAUPRSCDRAFT_10353 [Caulochytrium protostelioides]RKP02622.1 hypothetical protein CXG81DRAFT_17760 [Caulochytrium protostelioides]|eukprot:RKP02622.1 hypothetical protein CXG81DRAFT_17760 [Caulochytrium protostelioides]
MTSQPPRNRSVGRHGALGYLPPGFHISPRGSTVRVSFDVPIEALTSGNPEIWNRYTQLVPGAPSPPADARSYTHGRSPASVHASYNGVSRDALNGHSSGDGDNAGGAYPAAARPPARPPGRDAPMSHTERLALPKGVKPKHAGFPSSLASGAASPSRSAPITRPAAGPAGARGAPAQGHFDAPALRRKNRSYTDKAASQGAGGFHDASRSPANPSMTAEERRQFEETRQWLEHKMATDPKDIQELMRKTQLQGKTPSPPPHGAPASRAPLASRPSAPAPSQGPSHLPHWSDGSAAGAAGAADDDDTDEEAPVDAARAYAAAHALGLTASSGPSPSGSGSLSDPLSRGDAAPPAAPASASRTRAPTRRKPAWQETWTYEDDATAAPVPGAASRRAAPPARSSAAPPAVAPYEAPSVAAPAVRHSPSRRPPSAAFQAAHGLTHGGGGGSAAYDSGAYESPTAGAPARRSGPGLAPGLAWNGEPLPSDALPEAAGALGDMAPCHVCGRTFAADRLAKHVSICAKTASKAKTRKVKLGKDLRTQGTELAKYQAPAPRASGPKAGVTAKPRAVPAAAAPSEPGAAVPAWKQKHEELVNSLRAAKALQRHLAAGGKASDLAAPPPAVNTGSECRTCGRKFNESALERHQPICEKIANKKVMRTGR